MATTIGHTMRAAVLHTPGPTAQFVVQSFPTPVPKTGQVLIRVKAFGINRSEFFTRLGFSPGIVYPRILGIEAAGIVEEAPGNEFQKGDVVVTCMGGMGRAFHGGYAEYTCVPATQVQVIKSTTIPWEILGALPEMMQTTWGSLFKSLQLKQGDRVLIRGGTSSVGLAAAAIAKSHGAFVAATSRNPDQEQMLRANGADDVFIDSGEIAAEVKKRYPAKTIKLNAEGPPRPHAEGFDKVLELVGVTTLKDSLRCLKEGGIACMTGIVGGKWVFDEFDPVFSIPTGVYLTVYAGSADALQETPIQLLAEQVIEGTLKIPVKTFQLDDINEAHRLMEENVAAGKLVVLL